MGLKRNRKRTRGMAMVEMIFVLPLLILLVFAIAEFGLMFSRWLTLSNAVREGARTGVVFRNPCDKPTVEGEVQNTAKAYAQAGGIRWDKVSFTVSGACDGTGKTLEVFASYDFPLNIPYGPLSSLPIAYSSKMRNE